MKLVAMSASVLSFNRDDAFNAGCDDFLPKPFREADLFEKIGRLLRLDWIHTEEPAAHDAGAAPAGPRPAIDPAALADLLGCAQRGEIVALRTRLATFRAGNSDPLLARLDAMAANFEMEKIRLLLEETLAAARVR